MLPLLLLVSAPFVLWIFYFVLRRFVVPSPLDEVRGPSSDSVLFGSLRKLLSTKGWDYHQYLAEAYPGVAKVKGLLGANTLFINDPIALEYILNLKDQSISEECELFSTLSRIVFGEGIFTSVGEAHRRRRKMLNPVFSISHMRSLVPVLCEVARRVENTLTQMTSNGPKEIDMMDWVTRTTLECIGQAGLGFSLDTLEEGSQPHPYAVASKQLLPLSTQDAPLLGALLPLLVKLGTPEFWRFIVERIPLKQVQHIRGIVDTLFRTSVEIYEKKKRGIEEGGGGVFETGRDVISVLMRANLDVSEEEKLSEEELLGQITSLTFAATDTTATALARVLHLLSMHKDAQDRLRKEIREVRRKHALVFGSGDVLSYETLVNEMPFLGAVCRETLRLYPPVAYTMRSTRQDTRLPISQPIKSTNGYMLSQIPVPKGTDIYISILTSNTNRQVWGDDACEWNPERWLAQRVVGRGVPGLYSNLMTFWGGGRSCIGYRLALLVMKVVLARLVDNLDFSLGEKEIFWNMMGVATPHVEPGSCVPTMPLVVGRARG